MSDGLWIIVLSKVVPYDGISHAGGEYVRRHVRALLDLGHSVTVVAPRDPRNLHALSQPHDPFETYLVGSGLASLPGRVQTKLWGMFDRTVIPANVRRAFRRDPDVGRLLRQADVVDVQWTEMMSVLMENDAGAGAGVVLVAHDVLVQREERRLSTVPAWRFVRRAVRKRSLRKATVREKTYLARADRVVVLSRKDEQLIAGAFPDAAPRSIDPPLWDGRSQANPRVNAVHASRVVMIGAFNRPENHEAAVWLLKEVWPLIREACPDATLMLVGARPSGSLQRLVQGTPGATATGYVESLAEVYATATVAVAPLLSGAGIKFKSIDALLLGVPLVATHVGAEGIHIDQCEDPICIHDEQQSFADAVVAVIGDASAQTRAEEIAGHARIQYGMARFRERLAAIVDEASTSTGSSPGARKGMQGGTR